MRTPSTQPVKRTQPSALSPRTPLAFPVSPSVLQFDVGAAEGAYLGAEGRPGGGGSQLGGRSGLVLHDLEAQEVRAFSRVLWCRGGF